MLVACAATVNGEVRNLKLVGQSSSEQVEDAFADSLCSYIEEGLDWMPYSTSCNTSLTSPVSCSTKSGSSAVLCNVTLDLEFNSTSGIYEKDAATIYVFQNLVPSWVGNNSFDFNKMQAVHGTADISVEREILLDFNGLESSLVRESTVGDLIEFVELVCTGIMEALNDHVNTNDYGMRCLLYKIVDIDSSVGAHIRIMFDPSQYNSSVSVNGMYGMDAFAGYITSNTDVIFNLTGILQNVTISPLLAPANETQRDVFLELQSFNGSQLIDYETNGDRYSNQPQRFEFVERMCELVASITADNVIICTVYGWNEDNANIPVLDSAIRLTYPSAQDEYWMDATTTHLSVHIVDYDATFNFSDTASSLHVLYPDPETVQRDIELEFGGKFNYMEFDSRSYEYRAEFVRIVCQTLIGAETSVTRCNMYHWSPGDLSINTMIRLTFEGLSAGAMDTFAAKATTNVTAFSKVTALQNYNVTSVNNMTLSYDSSPPEDKVDLTIQRELLLKMVGKLEGGTEASYYADMMARSAAFKQSFNDTVTGLVKDASTLADSVKLVKWYEGSIVTVLILTYPYGTPREAMTADVLSVANEASAFASKLSAFGVTSVTGSVPQSSIDAGLSDNDDDDSNKSLAIGLGVGLGVGVPLVAAVIFYCIWRRRKEQVVAPGAQSA